MVQIDQRSNNVEKYNKQTMHFNYFNFVTVHSVGCVAAARNQHNLHLNVQRAVQAAYMFTMTCKILFFVLKQQSHFKLMIMLECVEFEKVEETIQNRKTKYNFDIVRNWTSKDIFMILNRTIIKVDVIGKFSMPRGIKRKSPAISFNP